MLHNFQESDFAGLHYRVDKVDVFTFNPNHSFPEINKFKIFSKEFTEELGDEYRNVFAYIVYVYDYRSPFVKYNDTVFKRKKSALEAAGFRKGRGDKYSKLAESLFLNGHTTCNQMIIQYLKILKSDEWMSMVSYQEALGKQTEMLLTGKHKDESGVEVNVEPKVYSDIIKNTEALRNNMKLIRIDFVTQDDNANLIEAIYDSIESETITLTPEQYAMQVYIGKNPELFNPYERDIPVEEYIIEHLRHEKKEIQTNNSKTKRNSTKKST